jgi:tetratricopeptide (TPR) repeat protein
MIIDTLNKINSQPTDNTWTILAIIIPLVAALIGFLWRKYKIKVNKYYDIRGKSSQNIKANEFLEDRPYYKYYHLRDEDIKLRRAIEEHKNVIVIGKSLSGKTRAIFEALKILKSPYYIFKLRGIKVDTEDFFIPKKIFWWRIRVLFINDLHIFVNEEYFQHALRLALNEKICIVATCRSEIEQEYVEKKLTDNGLDLSTVFSEILHLLNVEEKVAKKAAKEAGKKWDPVNFDGTIGSAVMPLAEMTNRFRNSEKEEMIVLLSIKKMYKVGLYYGINLFHEKWLRKIVETEMHIQNNSSWYELLEKLKKKEFISLTNRDKLISIEIAYLERIIVSAINFKSLAEEMNEKIILFKETPEALELIGDRAFNIALPTETFYDIAIQSYTFALNKYRSDNKLKEKANISIKIGNVFCRYENFKNSRENLLKAIEHYTEAFNTYADEKYSLEFATAMDNLGVAYSHLSNLEVQRDNQFEDILNSIAYHQLSIEKRRIHPNSIAYARSQNNLGTAFYKLAFLKEPDINFSKSLNCYNEALTIYTIDKLPSKYAMIQINIAAVYWGLIKKSTLNDETKVNNLRMCIFHSEKALSIYDDNKQPTECADTYVNLGIAYSELSNFNNKSYNLYKSVEFFQKALDLNEYNPNTNQYALTCENFGVVYTSLAIIENPKENYKKALIYFYKAATIYDKLKRDKDYNDVIGYIKKVEKLIQEL